MIDLHHGDSLFVMNAIAAESVDSLVTDPPAGISFMGKAWDGDKGGRDGWVKWLTDVMVEAKRVLKPGAHGFVWSLPRTSHWTATALENAGFEVRDIVTHVFGTGFPKSLNVGEGRGTALKPASEHWVLVRKPLGEKTVARNVERHGTGAINIDASRIGTEQIESGRAGRGECESKAFGKKLMATEMSFSTGRFPANFVLSHNDDCEEACTEGCAVAALDRQNELRGKESGGASRFFYCAKPSKRERGDGNVHPTVKSLKLMTYLITMITPSGGMVLDPFMGSGTTGLAAKGAGFRFVGIEQEQEYFEISRKRMK